MPMVGSNAAVMRAVPTAFDPAWLQQTYTGTFGSAGLHAHADHITSNVDVARSGLTGSFKALGGVLGPDGAPVGQFERTGVLHASGRLEVKHDWMSIAHEGLRGTGFGRAFNDHAVARYLDAGVDDVTLTAFEVGGYAWARQGFELLVPGADDAARASERSHVLASMLSDARSTGRISDAEYAAASERRLSSVQDLAAIPEIGRKVLLDREWKGIRDLTPSAAWWQSHEGAQLVGEAPTVTAARQVGATLEPGLDPFRSGAGSDDATRISMYWDEYGDESLEVTARG